MKISPVILFTTLITFAAQAELQVHPQSSDEIRSPKGFVVEKVVDVTSADAGSWVAITFDNKGRLIGSDQYGALYRTDILAGGKPEKLKLPVELIGAQGLLYAFDSLYVMRNEDMQLAKANGIYRLQDTTGDDSFDKVDYILPLKGNGEHGVHGLTLSPDGRSITFVGGNSSPLPEKIAKSYPSSNWEEDYLLPPLQYTAHWATLKAPGGWIAKVSPDGKDFTLLVMGLRNPYDMAYNAHGELFTFDSDMERDAATSWYRPTRINHLTPGGDSGWRTGSNKWPPFYADSLPATVDIGLGSPTGVIFGHHCKYPLVQQQALFALDWRHGRILQVNLKPYGGTYTASFETFVEGEPLPVTDIAKGPDDCLYFAVGGRKTQSSVYRIRYTGSTPEFSYIPEGKYFAKRRQLENLLGKPSNGAVERAWPDLKHPDRFVRDAARRVLEHQPIENWAPKAISESDPTQQIFALMALARSKAGHFNVQALEELAAINCSELSIDDQLALLRTYQLWLARHGKPSPTTQGAILKQLNLLYPAPTFPANHLLSDLLVYLEADGVAERTLELLENAPTQEEAIHYSKALRLLDTKWTVDSRKRYFAWLSGTRMEGNRAVKEKTDRVLRAFSGFMTDLKADALSRVPDNERAAIDALLAAGENSSEPVAYTNPRGPATIWTLGAAKRVMAETAGRKADLKHGKEMFRATGCAGCHISGDIGVRGAPDLSEVANRFSVDELLESIIHPNAIVSDQFGLGPDRTISPMPPGLINVLGPDDLRDLVAYIQSKK
jgi:mono/diheme cytochrome c family protein